MARGHRPSDAAGGEDQAALTHTHTHTLCAPGSGRDSPSVVTKIHTICPATVWACTPHHM